MSDPTPRPGDLSYRMAEGSGGPAISSYKRGECPGVSEYGHGLTLRVVHAGGCCAKWEARQDGKR